MPPSPIFPLRTVYLRPLCGCQRGVQGFISYTKTPSAPAMRWRARSHTQYTVSVSQTQTRYNSRSSQQMYVARACTPFPWRCEAGRAGARTPRAVMRGRPVAAPGVSVAVLERQLTWGAHPRGAHAVPLPCPYHGERETSARPQGSYGVALPLREAGSLVHANVAKRQGELRGGRALERQPRGLTRWQARRQPGGAVQVAPR